MHSTKVELLPVTQADREAAAQLYLAEEVISSGPRDRIGTNSPFDLARAASMRDGEYDHWDIVQAFARHRIASTPSRGGEDRLRTVSRALHEHLCRRDVMQYLDNDEDCEGLARSVLAALDGTRVDAGEGNSRPTSPLGHARACLRTAGETSPVQIRRADLQWIIDRFPVCNPDATSTGEGLTSGEGREAAESWLDLRVAPENAQERDFGAGDMVDAYLAGCGAGHASRALYAAAAWIDSEATTKEPPARPTVGFKSSRDPEEDDGNETVREAFEEGVYRGLWLAAKEVRKALASEQGHG